MKQLLIGNIIEITRQSVWESSYVYKLLYAYDYLLQRVLPTEKYIISSKLE